MWKPDVILAPFLKRAIPPLLWQRHLCLVVHPGPPGDRGPAALDWAILRGEIDLGRDRAASAGGVRRRPGLGQCSLSHALRAQEQSISQRSDRGRGQRGADGARPDRAGRRPAARPPRDGNAHGWQPALRQQERAIDWARDDTATVLRKIHSADGFPGLEDQLFGRRFKLFDARAELHLVGQAGAIIARRHEAICRATADGAVWIGQLQPADADKPSFKRPAVSALGDFANSLPESAADVADIRYEESGPVGYLHFDFYNGALSTAQCDRLRSAYALACGRPTRVIVLMGGCDFWCNGMHLHCIESADSPADASWTNINRIDDLAGDILRTDTHLTIAALQGNAAAGGVFLALAADCVLARSGIVLNPHYRSMGNLYGSEYWTYLLPRRVGAAEAGALMARRLPLGAPEARRLGLIDDHAGPEPAAFRALVDERSAALAAGSDFAQALSDKRRRRALDEQSRPLADYRAEELTRMRLNFYGFDPSYHIARHRFVYRTPHAWTPLHLARHRRPAA